MQKNDIARCVFSFMLGAIVCAGVGYCFIVRPSLSRIGQLGNELTAATEYNNRITEGLNKAKGIAGQNISSVQKLRDILTTLKELEQSSKD